MTTRRFPAPWRADKIPGGYVVRDANGQAYIYSRDNEDEARQKAAASPSTWHGCRSCSARRIEGGPPV